MKNLERTGQPSRVRPEGCHLFRLSGGSRPRLPWCAAIAPETIENSLFAQRIHRMPEAVMAIDAQLTVFGQSPQWFLLPHCVGLVDIFQSRRLEYEKPSVYPGMFVRWFFFKLDDS